MGSEGGGGGGGGGGVPPPPPPGKTWQRCAESDPALSDQLFAPGKLDLLRQSGRERAQNPVRLFVRVHVCSSLSADRTNSPTGRCACACVYVCECVCVCVLASAWALRS